MRKNTQIWKINKNKKDDDSNLKFELFWGLKSGLVFEVFL